MNHIPSLLALQNAKKNSKNFEEQNLFPQNLSSTSLFAKDQKTAKPLKKKIFLLKSYPPHLSTCSPCFLRPPPSGEPTKQSQGTSKQCRNLEMTKSQI